MTRLHRAVTDNAIGLIRQLLDTKQVDANVEDEHKRTPLHFAAHKGLMDIAKLLMQHGASPLVSSDQKITPLHLAALQGHLDMVNLLLDAKADPAAADNARRMSHHYAATKGHTPVVMRLLQAGARAECPGECGQTALHLAALGGHADLAKVLLRCGASPNTLDGFGQTPVALAQSKGHAAVVDVLQNTDPAEDDKEPLVRVRAYLQNGSYKMFMVTQPTTIGDLGEMLRDKMASTTELDKWGPMDGFKPFFLGPSTVPIRLELKDRVRGIMQSWDPETRSAGGSASCQFVFHKVDAGVSQRITRTGQQPVAGKDAPNPNVNTTAEIESSIDDVMKALAALQQE